MDPRLLFLVAQSTVFVISMRPVLWYCILCAAFSSEATHNNTYRYCKNYRVLQVTITTGNRDAHFFGVTWISFCSFQTDLATFYSVSLFTGVGIHMYFVDILWTHHRAMELYPAAGSLSPAFTNRREQNSNRTKKNKMAWKACHISCVRDM